MTFEKVVVCNQTISEELVLQAHKILTFNVDSASDSYGADGSVYRTTDFCAGLTTFAYPENVSREMRAFVADLSSGILVAEKLGNIDTYVLAAKYCHKFVNVHPSDDGNGCMCRLILNILISRYAGVFCVLGEDEQEKDAHLSIAARGSQSDQIWKETDEEEATSIKRPWGQLALLVLHQRRTTCKKSSTKKHFSENLPSVNSRGTCKLVTRFRSVLQTGEMKKYGIIVG